MMKSALLFFCKLVVYLSSMGYMINPYNSCVANKIINGAQMTICWHVDDLFIGHADPAMVTKIIHWLACCYQYVDILPRPPSKLEHNLVYLYITTCLYDGILTGYDTNNFSLPLAWILAHACCK
jgi:hypothetical protein